MQRHDQPNTIIAILGADTVVGSALSALLESHGYNTVVLDSHPEGAVDELLDGAHLLIMTPRVDEDVRNAFLAGIAKSAPQKGRMPVIALSTTTPAKETGSEQKEGVVMVPWPSEIEHLVERIEAALLDVPAPSPHLPPKPGRAESASGTVMRPFQAPEEARCD